MATFGESLGDLVDHIELARRRKTIYLLFDCSTSMGDNGKIDEANTGLQLVGATFVSIAAANENIEFTIQLITFGGTARLATPQPVPIAEFRPAELKASGGTPLGAALRLVKSALDIDPGDQKRAPAIIIITDAAPTDDFDVALSELMKSEAARKADRIGIMIGNGNPAALKKFVSPEYPVLTAATADEIGKYLVLATRIAMGATGPAFGGISIPPSPQTPSPKSSSYVIDSFGDSFGNIEFLDG